MSDTKTQTHGWRAMEAAPESPGRLVGTTEQGKDVAIRVNLKETGRNEGLTNVHRSNPDGTYTSVVIDAEGNLLDFVARGPSMKHNNEQLKVRRQAL